MKQDTIAYLRPSHFLVSGPGTRAKHSWPSGSKIKWKADISRNSTFSQLCYRWFVLWVLITLTMHGSRLIFTSFVNCPYVSVNLFSPQLLFTLTFWLLLRQSVKEIFSRKKTIFTQLQEVTTRGERSSCPLTYTNMPTCSSVYFVHLVMQHLYNLY